ncbi:MAG: OmpH family outer membrane protein [Bacteroidetes bacterium]|nr:OmpH family outer membrane protein [Bacteroidota bacterium]
MKKVTFLTVLIALTSLINAQKIAHIDLDSLVNVMPEMKTAKEMAQTYMKDLEKTLLQMDEELQKKYNDYMANQATMSDLVKKTKEDEINSLQRRIEDFRMQAQQDYQKKQGELTAPIVDKAKKAIEAVAKEGGYKYVLDTSPGTILYFESTEDVFVPVKKKLDAMPPAVLPSANTDKPKTTPAPNKTGVK